MLGFYGTMRKCSVADAPAWRAHVLANGDGRAVQQTAVEVHVAARADGNVVALRSS